MIIEDLTDLHLLAEALDHFKHSRARGAQQIARTDILLSQVMDELATVATLEDY